jgi:hypothetical protein
MSGWSIPVYGAIISEAASTNTPTAGRAARYSATAGLLRGALSSYAFAKTALATGTSGTMSFSGGTVVDLVIPVGWKFDVYALSCHVTTDAGSGQTIDFHLTVDDVDVQSSSHPNLRVTGTAGVDTKLTASVDASPFPYTIDATSAVKRVNVTMVNGGASVSNSAGCTIFGCLYKP